MSSVERKTVYFELAGRHNTDIVLRLAKEYAEAQGIRTIVVASTTGETGVKAAQMFKDIDVVVVTHHVGFREPGMHELREDFRNQILKHGAKILTSTHALSSVERAIRKKFGTLQPLELMANTLRLLGEGTKVCVEIAVMATDAGLAGKRPNIFRTENKRNDSETKRLQITFRGFRSLNPLLWFPFSV